MTLPSHSKHLPLKSLPSTTYTYDELIAHHTAVGYVQDAHGVKGDMHWVFFSEEPHHIWKSQTPVKVWLCPRAPGKHRPSAGATPLEGWWLEVMGCHTKSLNHKTIGHMKVKGIQNREMALALKGCELWMLDIDLSDAKHSETLTKDATKEPLIGVAVLSLPLYQYRGLNVYSQESFHTKKPPIGWVSEVLETGDGTQCFLELTSMLNPIAEGTTQEKPQEKPLIPLNPLQVVCVHPQERAVILEETLYTWLLSLWEDRHPESLSP
ncbi:MAG: hypothetical protein ACKO37_04425 [Vampirovibrionales bacterium]